LAKFVKLVRRIFIVVVVYAERSRKLSTGERFAFVDESGDPTLPEYNPVTPDIYVIAVVICDSNSLADHEREANRLIRQHAGPGELKSSTIGSDVERRKEILSDIATVGFKYYWSKWGQGQNGVKSGLK
jgi:hypothetical protein